MEAIHPWTWKELLVFSYYQRYGRPSRKCQQQSQIWCMQFKNASLLKTWTVTRIAISSNKFQIAKVSDLISTSLALCFSWFSCGVVDFPKRWSLHILYLWESIFCLICPFFEVIAFIHKIFGAAFGGFGNDWFKLALRLIKVL